MTVLIQWLAFGTLRRGTDGFVGQFIGGVAPRALNAAAQDSLQSHLDDVMGRSEAHGDAHPGWCDEPTPPAEVVDLAGGSPLGTAARQAMVRLRGGRSRDRFVSPARLSTSRP